MHSPTNASLILVSMSEVSTKGESTGVWVILSILAGLRVEGVDMFRAGVVEGCFLFLDRLTTHWVVDGVVRSRGVVQPEGVVANE